MENTGIGFLLLTILIRSDACALNCVFHRYSLMVQCWNLDPEQRTTISDLVLILSQLATRSPEHEGYMETSSCTYESLQNSYVNAEIDVEYSSLQEDATSEET